MTNGTAADLPTEASVHLAELSKFRVFAEWPLESLARLAAVAQPRTFDEGDILFHYREPLSGLHAVIEGTLLHGRPQKDGRPYLVEVCRPGQLIGLIPMMDGGVSLFESKVLTPVRTLFFPKDHFVAAVESDVRTAMTVARQLTRRWRVEITRGETLCMGSPRFKVAHIIMYYSRGPQAFTTEPVQVPFPITQEIIAASLGLSRQAVATAIDGLVKDGIVAKRYRNIVVTDLPALLDLTSEGELETSTGFGLYNRPEDLHRSSD